jgi:hypothetical protein
MEGAEKALEEKKSVAAVAVVSRVAFSLFSYTARPEP